MQTITLPIEAIAPCPFNRHDANGVAALAENIRQFGLLQPPRVRPWPKTPGYPPAPKGATHELICGERRWRAFGELDRKEMPVILDAAADDLQATLARLSDNAQREDLDAFQEGDAYRDAISRTGVTVEKLAEQIGRKRSHIFARMRAAALGKAVRARIVELQIPASIAEKIATIPQEAAQLKAAKEIGLNQEWDYDDEGHGSSKRSCMSAREAEQHIERNYRKNLKNAPFEVNHAALVKGVPACAGCPKRSGNLEPDTQSPNVCTDPACFLAKQEAWVALKLAEAKAKKLKIIPEADAKGLFPYQGELRSNAAYVDLGATCEPLGWDVRKTWKTALGKHAPAPVIAVDPQGKVHELLPKAAAAEALKAAGVKVAEPNRGGKPVDRKGVIEENKTARAITAALVEGTLALALKVKPEKFWPLVLVHMCQNYKFGEQLKEGLGMPDEDDTNALAAGLARLPFELQNQVILKAWLTDGENGWNGYEAEEVGSLFGVDHEKIEKEVRARRKEEIAAKEAKAEAKKSKGESKLTPITKARIQAAAEARWAKAKATSK